VPQKSRRADGTADLHVMLSTEDSAYTPDPRPVVVESHGNGVRLTFVRPSAVVIADSQRVDT